MLGLLLLASAACAADDERPTGTGWVIDPPAGDGGGAPSNDGEEGGAEPSTSLECVPGVVKSCKVTLPSQGTVKNCFVGERVCGDDGAWGPCDEPIEAVDDGGDAPEDASSPSQDFETEGFSHVSV